MPPGGDGTIVASADCPIGTTSEADADGDGVLDADEGNGDDDCDGTPNVQDSDDADGPCAQQPALTYQSGACAGANSTALPAGTAGIALLLLGLVGLRRRRE